MRKKITVFALLAAMVLSGCSESADEKKPPDKTPETVTDESSKTEEDLPENECLVHGVIFSYRGSGPYEITKKDDDNTVIKADGAEISVSGYDNDKNIELTKKVLEASEGCKDEKEYVYYTLEEAGKKTVVYLQCATLEITWEGNADALKNIVFRKSELDCC